VPDLIPDRIDFIMATGPSRTLESRVIGETDGPDVDLALAPWPSDHRAVVSAFASEPAFPGAVVTVDRAAVIQGEAVVIRYLAELSGDGWRVGIREPAGGLLEIMSIGDGTDRRAVTFGTAALAPGGYDAVLVAPDDSVRAERRFWILDRTGWPEVGSTQARIPRDAPIRVWWRNAPAHRYDWIGLYRAGEVDPSQALAHAYTGAAAFGEITLARRTLTELAGAAPIEPGDYQLRLMRDDAYVTLAMAPLRIG
jgi:hypothetical protein